MSNEYVPDEYSARAAEWQRVYTDPKVRAGVPSAPETPHVTPLVRQPTCPEHCRNHHVEAQMTCVTCGGVAYDLVAHEWPWTNGHYWYSFTPRNGAPPHEKGMPMCCGQALRRI